MKASAFRRWPVTLGLIALVQTTLWTGGLDLYLQIDFISSLEYTIVNECSRKVIYGEIMMEYLSIKQI